MKNLFTILVLLFFALESTAGLPPTTTRGSADSVDITTFKFRFPNIAITHTGTIASFGTVAVAGGGTGATSLTANNVILGNGTSAVQFVAPSTSGNVLRSNGTTWESSASGGGDVVGPASSVDGEIALMDGATGKLLKSATGTGIVRIISGVISVLTDVMRSPGIVEPKTCHYVFGGASSTLSAPTNCTTGTCVETVDTCATGTPPAFSTTGVYNAMTWAAGTWANNSFIDCKCQALSEANSQSNDCSYYFVTGQDGLTTSASGGYVTSIVSTIVSTSAPRNAYIIITCKAAAP